MHMLKPVLSTQISLKDRHSFTSPTELKNPNQQNKSLNPKTYTPYHHKHNHGIDLSLKTSQNRQTIKTSVPSNPSQQYLDGYLQKVIKSNFDKITQIRTQHERQRETLLHEIISLKTENTLLKDKIQEQSYRISITQSQKSKQLSHSKEKGLQYKLPSERRLSPNPEKQQQNQSLIKNMKQKMEILSREIEEYKKQNSILFLQKRNLNLTIEKLQKQSQQKLGQLQSFRKIEQKLTKDIKQIRSLLENTRAEHEADKINLLKQIQKLRKEKQTRKEKQKERQRKTTHPLIIAQQYVIKSSHDNKSTVDKKLIKHLESQIKQRDAQISDRNTLIDELNEKIMSTALIGLNTKYKYLSKP